MALKVGDKVNVFATSMEFAYTTLAHVLNLDEGISCEVVGLNEDGSANVVGWDHVGQQVNLKSVKEKKTSGDGWYIK